MDRTALLRAGAEARIAELEKEIAEVRAFLDPGTSHPVRHAKAKSTKIGGGGKWTPAKRKAAKARMEAYWGKRRAEKAAQAIETPVVTEAPEPETVGTGT